MGLEALFAQEFARGVETGKQQATSIDLGWTGYGSRHSHVIVLYGKSRNDCRRQARERLLAS